MKYRNLLSKKILPEKPGRVFIWKGSTKTDVASPKTPWQ